MQDNFEKTSEDFIQCLDKITKILHIVAMVLIAISTLGIFSLLITKDQKASDQTVPEGKNLPIILSSTMGARNISYNCERWVVRQMKLYGGLFICNFENLNQANLK